MRHDLDGLSEASCAPLSASWGGEIAVRFTPDYHPCVIEKVVFFVPKTGQHTTKFLAEVYADENGQPTTSLCSGVYLAAATNGDEWVEVDLTGEIVREMDGDFWVAMRWLNAPGTGGTQAQYLGMDTNATLVQDRVMWKIKDGDPWVSPNSAHTCPYVPLIRAEVKYDVPQNAIPVYRFTHKGLNSFMFTTDANERDWIIATLSAFYDYDGEKFKVMAAQATGLSPVYRFYNTGNSVHIYTIDENEANWIKATFSHINYEGVAYYGSKTSAPGTVPLYRILDLKTYAHLYTTDLDERNNILARGDMQDEGVAYYVYPAPQASGP